MSCPSPLQVPSSPTKLTVAVGPAPQDHESRRYARLPLRSVTKRTYNPSRQRSHDLQLSNQPSQDLVSKKRESGELPDGNQVAEKAYLVKVFTTIFERKAAWMVPTEQSNISTLLDIRKVDFTADRLGNEARQLKPTPPESSRIGEFLKGMRESIKRGDSKGKPIARRIWDRRVFYQYDRTTKTIQAIIQIFNIGVNATFYNTNEPGRIPPGGPNVAMVKIEPHLGAVQYYFNNAVYVGLQSEIGETLRDVGKRLLGGTLDLAVLQQL